MFSTRIGGAGAELHAGERWEANGSTVINLAGGGQMRLARNTVIGGIRGESLLAARGKSVSGLSGSGGTLRSAYGAGIHRASGTQFEVASSGDDVRIRVREGSVQLHTPEGTEVTRAGNELFVPEFRSP
jgi:hypothetical protein